jgi:hypothetical protein
MAKKPKAKPKATQLESGRSGASATSNKVKGFKNFKEPSFSPSSSTAPQIFVRSGTKESTRYVKPKETGQSIFFRQSNNSWIKKGKSK